MTLDVELEPLAGIPAELSGRAHEAAGASALVEDARSSLRHVRGAVTGQRSRAVTAATDRLASVDERLLACATVLDGAATLLHRHAEELAGLQADARQALADRGTAVARERRWQAEVDDARRSTWNAAALASTAPGTTGLGFTGPDFTGLGAAAPGDEPHRRLVMAQQQLAVARADVVAAEARWRAARDAKAAASRRAAAALGALADVRAVRVASAAGMSAAQFRQSSAEGQRAVALLTASAHADGRDDRREARTGLRDLFSSHHDDPAFWAAFWDGATPHEVYLALGPDPAAPGPVDASVRTALADGVAQWARSASATERRAFGHAVAADVGDGVLGLSHRSELAAELLAGDLPAEVYAGAGDALDRRWDRFADLPADGTPPGSGDRPPTRGFLVDATVTAPLAAAVLTGYARHPRLALDRLAPPAGTGAAARRWLGWVPRGGWPDDGQAVSAAFAAAVQTGASSDGRGEQSRAALLVSHATTEMPRGLLSGPTLSDAASASIADAYEPYLSRMGDAARTQTEDSCDDTSLATALSPPPATGIDPDPVLAPGTGLVPPVVQPELDAFALRDVIAATSRTPDAAGAWLGGTDRYAAGMTDRATSGAYDVNHGPRNSLVQAALTDVAAVTGAMNAETLDQAYDTVATRETLISLTGVGLGVGTIGRTTTESLAGAAASTGLAFLDMQAPIAEARSAVSSVKEQTYHRYATTMHDLVLAHDLDRGVPLDQAWDNTAAIDPMDSSQQIRDSFEPAFDKLSEDSPDKECE